MIIGRGTFVPDGRESLDRLKQRTYVIVLSVGLLGAASAMLINELASINSAFTRTILLTAIAFLALQVWLVYGGRLRVEIVEESIYAGISALALCVLFYALYLDPSPVLAEVSLFSLYFWLPSIYIFIFLIREGKSALFRAGVLYLLILCVSLPHALSTIDSGRPLDGFNALGQLYLSTASSIAVLFFFTKLKGQLRETQTLAQTDALTGIPNRRQIERLLELELERTRRYDLPFSLIFFDLDDFKKLNDSFGHDVGDRTLVEVTRLIMPHLRASDQFGRWGGEEFTILTTGTELKSAQQLADRLRTAIGDHHFEMDQHLSASFGIATYRPGDDGTTLIKRADVALYRAKAQGKDRVEIETAA